jgi:hypothetical protein
VAATNLGINDTTPVLDVYNACTAVLGKEPMAELGIMEFMRLVRRLKREVEARHKAEVKRQGAIKPTDISIANLEAERAKSLEDIRKR